MDDQLAAAGEHEHNDLKRTAEYPHVAWCVNASRMTSERVLPSRAARASRPAISSSVKRRATTWDGSAPRPGRVTLTAFALNGAIGLLLLLLGAAAGIVGFLIGPLITSAVSRRREFLADASGVELTRFPDGLVRALTKIENRGGMLARPVPEVAELFIVDPTGPSWFDRLLRSHPPTSERVERLEAMAREF